jgi:hypothetical protein
MKKAAWPFRLALMAGLASCNHASVQTTESYLGPRIPRPDHVYVSYFSIAPDEVRLDSGVGARISRATSDQPLGAQELTAARETQAALAESIVARLRKYGLPAEIANDPPRGSNDVLVQGQIVSIDQGNRARRILIGLGAGKSTVSADAQLYHLTRMAPPRFMMAFEGKADSGRMPGAAETMGAGAAAQRIGTSAALTGATHAGAEAYRTGDAAEAGSLADEIALRVGQLAVEQAWIAQYALQ